ncbi:TPA: orotate phosphoribosyltransferase [Candidatus Galligastranaerophilus intestinavium]|mgnify:FL=1|uniref:Orotate phosphoribosyltransferase n=1 Tax=Candidatus Galligastranaerophilus intestinavium TaxID=2840836 RepID=A0A9D1FGU5_9BACT|nr:orotate phosphoribosyltransferase [Candidatus Galligastranaerophilus intestinavium]
MSQVDVKQLLIDFDGLLNGHFCLTSGLHSDTYFQCAKLYQYPPVVKTIATELAKKLKGLEFDTVVSPAIGGIIFGYEVAAATDKRNLFVERKDGEMQLRRGYKLKKGERVLIVEDVITTARTIFETIEALKPFEIEVAGVACIVDRSAGKLKDKLNIISLLQVDPVTYEPDNCPLCKLGIEITKPGSRTGK